MPVLAGNVTTIPVFPAAVIEATLQAALLTAVRSRYRRKKLPLPAKDSDVVVAAIEIDSLFAVEKLSTLDDLLPFKVTEAVVKPGGYNSIAEAAKHVTGRIASKWKKHFEGAKP